MSGGANKMTPEYVRSLPTVGDEDLLYNYGGKMSDEVRVGQDVYKFYGGKGGNWEKIFTIPDDLYEDTSKTNTSSQSSNTYVPSGGSGGSGPSSSGYGNSGWGTQLTGNIYHPQLVQEYSRPDMVPVEGLLDPRNPLSYIGDGALYQPGTVQSAAFTPDGIVGYQPPELNVGRPEMVGNPYGSLRFLDEWEELLTGFDDPEESNTSKGTRGK